MISNGLDEWRNARQFGPPDANTLSRTPGQRDRDRLLYSPSVRRLQAVTQVILAADEGYLQHNRLTHSLKVAQVGRRIAENILRAGGTSKKFWDVVEDRGGLDPDVVEAAGLAHDLGHPPFGHIAESELQDIVHALSVADSFEGNAQSFRIVTRLAAIRTEYPGLNLSRATLNAILKYPWTRSGLEKKWGCYTSDNGAFEWARDGRFPDRAKTLEAEIMDWADDITYAIHDVEDFFRVGLIPLPRMRTWSDPGLQAILARTVERLASESDPKYRITVTKRGLRNAWAETLATFTITSYDESATNRAKLARYSSGLIDSLIMGTSLRGDGALRISQALRVQVAILKELTKRFVVEAPALATQQEGQRQVVRDLFRVYRQAITKAIGDPSRDRPRLTATLFPTSMAETVEEVVRTSASDGVVCRTVADCIAGMTEAQATKIHHRLMGFEAGSLVDPAVA